MARVRVRLAAAIFLASGGLITFASVYWAPLLLIFALIPGLVGVAQMLAGLRLLRARGQVLSLGMATIGIFLGVSGFSASVLRPDTLGSGLEFGRTVLSAVVTAANAFVLFVVVRDGALLAP